MEKNTSILLGSHFNNFIKEKVNSGKFNSASEVVRSALRLLELEELKTKNLIHELELGEQSRMLDDFDPKLHLENLHKKHV